MLINFHFITYPVLLLVFIKMYRLSWFINQTSSIYISFIRCSVYLSSWTCSFFFKFISMLYLDSVYIYLMKRVFIKYHDLNKYCIFLNFFKHIGFILGFRYISSVYLHFQYTSNFSPDFNSYLDFFQRLEFFFRISLNVLCLSLFH